jgi:hypothetical protein
MKKAWGVSLMALFAALLVGMSASASNTAFTASQAPGVDGAAIGLTLNAVDCSSPGNCVAVGSQNGSGAIDVETAGKWKAVSPSARTGASSSNLTAVSCPAPGSCVAVGTEGSQGIIETQTGGTWKGTQVTGSGGLYSGSYQGALYSVSCPVAGSCAAVGQAVHDNSMGTEETDGLIANLIPGKSGKPSVWSAEKAPEYKDMKEPASLAGVSCSAPGECRAVGYALDDTTDHNQYALIDDEKKHVWAYGAAATPKDANSAAEGLVSISCIGSTFVCMSAGYYSTSKQGPDPMIQTTDSVDHSQVTGDLVPIEDTSADLDATSCSSNGFCQSVGLAFDSPGDKTYGYGWDGYIVSFKYGAPAGKSAGVIGSNTRSPSNANTTQHNENFKATSCTTQGVCVAVGTYVDTNDDDAGVIDTRTYDSDGNITKETDIRAPEPSDETSSDDQQPLNGASCNNSTHCVAVGAYFNDSNPRGVIETLGGSSKPPGAPTVSKVSPRHGHLAGSKKVTITGTNLTGATSVRFGSTLGTKLKVVSASKLTVVAPKEKAGRVNVRVTTAGGTSAVTKADRFTYVGRPSVRGVSPSHGAQQGGERVTITGRRLSHATKVRFGGTKAGHLKLVSSKKLVVTCPAHARGTVDVHVTTAGGTSATHHSDEFTYH